MKIRDLYFRMQVLDQATKHLTDTRELADRVGQTVATVETRVNDRASAPLQKVAAAAQTVQTTFSNFQNVGSNASRTLGAAGDAGAKAASGMDRAASATNRLAAGLSNVQTRAGQAASSVGQVGAKLDSIERGATKVSAATGAIVGISVYKAADYQELLKGIEARASSPEVAKEITSWVEEGGSKSYSSQFQRARAAAKLTTGAAGGLVGASDNADLQKEFLEELELTLAVQGAASNASIRTLGDADNMLESFVGGNVSSLNKLIPGYQLSNEKVAELREQYRRTMPELKNFNDQQVDLYIGMKEGLKIMKEANEGKDPIVSAVTEMRMAYEKLSVAIGTPLVGSFEAVASGLHKLATLAEKYPDATKYVSFGLALAFVGASGAVVSAQVLGALTTLKALGGVASVVTAPLKILTAAQWLLNVAMAANPIGILIIAGAALLALLVYIAYRTGALAKAWEYLKSLDLGGTLSAGVDWAKEKWSDFLAIVDGVSSKLKGMSAGEFLKGAISMAIKVSPGGMVAAVLTQKIPGLLTWIWDSITTLTDRLKDWLEGLIPDWLGQVVKWLQGAWGYLKDLYGTFRGWYDRLKMILFGGYNEQGQFEAGIATKIGDRIVDALRGAPLIGGLVTQMTAEGEAAQAKAEGKTESETMRELTGIDRFRGKDHAGEVYVIEYKAKDLYADLMQEKYGTDTLSWSEWQKLPDAHKGLFDEKLKSITIEAAKARGYDVDKAKAIEKAFSGGEPPVELPPAVEEHYAETGAAQQQQRTEAREAEQNILDFLGAEIPTGGAPTSVDAIEFAGRQIPVYDQADLRGTGWGTNVRINDSGQAVMEVDIDSLPHKQKLEFQQKYGFTQFVPKLERGGGVEETGGAVVHAGEEYSPAQVVRKTTAAERLADSILALFGLGETGAESREMARTAVPLPRSEGGEVEPGAGSESGPRVLVQVQGPLMHVDRIEREVDLNDAIWKLRTMLDDMARRGEGNYLGGGW